MDEKSTNDYLHKRKAISIHIEYLLCFHGIGGISSLVNTTRVVSRPNPVHAAARYKGICSSLLFVLDLALGIVNDPDESLNNWQTIIKFVPCARYCQHFFTVARCTISQLIRPAREQKVIPCESGITLR